MTTTSQHFRHFLLVAALCAVGATSALAQQPASTPTERQITKWVEEGLSLSSMVKLTVVEYYANYGQWPQDNAQAGLEAPEAFAINAIKSISTSADGTISIHYDDARIQSRNGMLMLKPTALSSGTVLWQCSASGIDARYVPKDCR